MHSMHKALGSTLNTKEVKARKKALQVHLRQRLPAATLASLAFFTCNNLDDLDTTESSGSYTATQSCLSNIGNAVF